ncbi:hypothetical protein ThvES_00018780 [Thiovulum sp. ES]|nr:hypothetical protein ThvES_00018780 [Thiovulum sp. ES]
MTLHILRISAETSSTLKQTFLFKQANFLAESGEEFAKIILKNRDSDLNRAVLNDGDFIIVLEFQYQKNSIVVIDIFVSHRVERIRYHKQIYRKVE